MPLYVMPSHEWPMWLRAKQRVGRDMLAATLRVEDRTLRRREIDMAGAILQEIRAAREADPAIDL